MRAYGRHGLTGKIKSPPNNVPIGIYLDGTGILQICLVSNIYQPSKQLHPINLFLGRNAYFCQNRGVLTGYLN